MHYSRCLYDLFKGINMTVCVSLVSNSRGCSIARRGGTTRDYNMMPPYFSTVTNILHIKSNLKSESRATAISVAMSPRYLGGKGRCRLHLGRENARTSFFGRLSVWKNCARPASSASRGDNEVDHAVCLKAGVPSCPDDVTWRSSANWQCGVADVNKQIRTDFKDVKCVSGDCYQPYRGNIW